MHCIPPPPLKPPPSLKQKWPNRFLELVVVYTVRIFVMVPHFFNSFQLNCFDPSQNEEMQVQVDDEFKMEDTKLLGAFESVKLNEEKHFKSPSPNHKRKRGEEQQRQFENDDVDPTIRRRPLIPGGPLMPLTLQQIVRNQLMKSVTKPNSTPQDELNVNVRPKEAANNEVAAIGVDRPQHFPRNIQENPLKENNLK